MEKTICDTCANRRRCNTLDRRRGMACTDYEKEEKDVSTESTQKR